MGKKKIKKVLVANRGEIAIRIFRACADLGLHTVAMYSKEDVYSSFRSKADEAYQIGEQLGPVGAYLDIDLIIDLAKKRGVDAIHPGYGFLAENADFARACEASGHHLHRPPLRGSGADGRQALGQGDRHAAAAFPSSPAATEPLKDGEEAAGRMAIEFGYPRHPQGGSRRRRPWYAPLRQAWKKSWQPFDLVHSEALKAFGNGDIFMEKFLERAQAH